MDPRRLPVALDELLLLDRAVTVDSGHFMGYAPMYLRIQSPDAFVFAQGFQSIGLGLASAIGAAVARPGRITVAALGDGGALMALPELETAARLGLGMLIVIYNDAAYSAEVHHFGPMGEPVTRVQFRDADFAAIGRAVGLDALTVRRRVDLELLREWAASASRTGLVIDAKVVPTVVAPWLEDAFRSHCPGAPATPQGIGRRSMILAGSGDGPCHGKAGPIGARPARDADRGQPSPNG